jgi:acyl carrier protein
MDASREEFERKQMKERLRQYLLNELLNLPPQASLADDDDLLLSGWLDSLGVVRLIAFIEESLSTTVPPEDVTIENFLTINAMSAYLSNRQVVQG